MRDRSSLPRSTRLIRDANIGNGVVPVGTAITDSGLRATVAATISAAALPTASASRSTITAGSLATSNPSLSDVSVPGTSTTLSADNTGSVVRATGRAVGKAA